jgi:adenylate kinase
MGAPGAGKGTQAEFICAEHKIPAISTGNIIRKAIADQTPVGIMAKSIVDEGKLLPDDVVIRILRERIAEDDCRNGFLLDGFPRTLAQAVALNEMGVDIDILLSIDATDEEIESRLTGRRVCPQCGATYHIETIRPAKEGICDKCGSELIRRKDDSPETVRERLKIYHEQTEPIKDFYKKLGKLKSVFSTSGDDNLPRVRREISEILGEIV